MWMLELMHVCHGAVRVFNTEGLLCMYRLPIYVGLWIHRF